MNEKMRAAQAALSEAVKALEDLAREARDNQSRSADAIRVLTRLAETLLESVQDIASDLTAEALEGGSASPA